MKTLSELSVKIFADGADKAEIAAFARNPLIKGFTTNPTLMRKAGVQDYKAFAKDILGSVNNLPISLEVFSDDFADMERQALEIAGWGKNVYVKIPITNTQGLPSYDLIRKLSQTGVKVNVTAILTLKQVEGAAEALRKGSPAFISVFAGRIADTGRDPVGIMAKAAKITRTTKNAELIWASPRELLNIFQADEIGCHIITVSPDVLKKLDHIGKTLEEYSLETVRMFHQDALAAGYKL